MNDSNYAFSLPLGGEWFLDGRDIVRCLAISRTALQEHLEGHVQEVLAVAHMPVGFASEGQCGGLRAAAHGHQASVLKWRLARPGEAEGSWASPASDLPPPIRSGQP